MHECEDFWGCGTYTRITMNIDRGSYIMWYSHSFHILLIYIERFIYYFIEPKYRDVVRRWPFIQDAALSLPRDTPTTGRMWLCTGGGLRWQAGLACSGYRVRQSRRMTLAVCPARQANTTHRRWQGQYARDSVAVTRYQYGLTASPAHCAMWRVCIL